MHKNENESIEFNDEKEIENFVGIESYAYPELHGIGGRYKYDFKDFIVKEINKTGETLNENHNEVHLFTNPPRNVYTRFVLKKSNIDTFDAIKQISDQLNAPLHCFSYSGLKDKRSVSLQKVAIQGDYGEKLRDLRIPNISIGAIHHSQKPIIIGSNKGNSFIITIRDIEEFDGFEDHVNKLFNLISINGFLNYYGLQRYGTFRPNSHIIGKHLLRSSYEKAFDEFVLQIYSSESEKSKKVRKQLHLNRDLKWGYNNFPTSLNYERMMIKYLINHPADFRGSVNKLPRSLIRLLISSFQSYIFNKLLSIRIKRGYSIFEPVEGDVISILDDSKGELTKVIYIYGDKYDHYLDKALEMNRAKIVVPIIGYDTNLDSFPLFNNFFRELLEQEDFDMSIFKSLYLKEFDFKGTFRAMLIKPNGLEVVNIAPDERFSGRLKMKIRFSLPSGTYATMLLRELMK